MGASFVGAVVSTLVVAETLRMCLGVQSYEVIDGSLRAVEHRTVVLCAESAPFNPARTKAKIGEEIRLAA